MLYSGKEKRYESHYMAPDWGPSRKSSCPLYTNRTRPKLSSSSSPHKPTTILHPPARGRASHLPPLPKAAAREWAQTPLPLVPGAPAALFDLLATLLASLSPRHQPPFPSPGLPMDSVWQKTMLTCPLPFHLSPPLFFSPLHVIIRMAVKANVTVSLPRSKFLSYLYIQFRIIFKSEHFEMKRTCVWTLVCHSCGLSGYWLSLSLFLASDLGIIIPTS